MWGFDSTGQQDVFAQQEALARRQKIAEAMFQAQMQQQAPSGNAGWLSVLAKALGGYMYGRQEQDNAKQQTELRGQYSEGLQQEMQRYLAQRDGGMMQPPGPPTEEGQYPSPIQQKGNPREAIVTAMASRYPEMQNIGKMDFQGLSKQSLTPKDILSLNGFDPKSRVAAAMAGGDISQLTPEGKEHVVDGRIIKTGASDKPVVVGDYRTKWGPNQVVNGEVVQYDETGKAHQVANRPPSISVSNTPILHGQKAGYDEAFKRGAARVDELGKTAQASVQLVGTLDQLQRLDKGGVFNGPTSSAAAWLGNLAAASGMKIDTNQIANTDAYNSIAKEAVQQLIGQYGGNRGVTKEEAAQIQAVIPQLSTNPQSRATLTAILKNVAQRKVQEFNTAQTAYKQALTEQDPSRLDFGPVNLPDQTPVTPVPANPAAGRVMSLDEWLRK